MDVALTNLISPGVLFFALGAFAALVKSDVGLPKQVAQTLALYLMAAIGFKGGAQLSISGVGVEALAALGSGLLLGITLPLIAFVLLQRLTRVSRVDAASIAAHYGSVSLVTFGAGLALLEEIGEPTEGYMAAVLALMDDMFVFAIFDFPADGCQHPELIDGHVFKEWDLFQEENFFDDG